MKDFNEQYLQEELEKIKEIQSVSKKPIALKPDVVFYVPEKDMYYIQWYLGEKH